MGYSHGKLWTDETIEKGIKEVMVDFNISTMPTLSMIKEYRGNYSLSNAIAKHGGSNYWAKKLELELKGCETFIGQEFEEYCSLFIQESLGLDVNLTPTKYPYDILANNNIKIDVKVSRMYNKSFKSYTFNLEKKFPTCDIFVAYCIDDDKRIVKTYVIPSSVLSGKTQLSVGVIKSKYDKYLDGWELLNKYNKFYDSLSK